MRRLTLGAVVGLGMLVCCLGWPLGMQGQADAMPMHISWGAAALIAFCYYLSQSAWLAGLGFWTLYRPLVGGTLVGLILGDPWTGARVGATINLAYLSFIATGGALPSDISLAGYLGTTLVLVGGLNEGAALALTVPVGMLGYLIYQLRMTLDVFFVHWADYYAARGNARGVAFCNVLPPQLLLLVLSFVPCFLGAYFGPIWLGDYLARLPNWLRLGAETVGGLLPALGIAMSLNLLWTRVTALYFVLGFVVAVLARLPILMFGLMAAFVAILHVCFADKSSNRHALTQPLSSSSAENAKGPNSRVGLSRRTLFASWLNWLFFSHACYNYERMQGAGFAHAMSPVLRKLYPQRERLAAALQRHLVYYNAEPNLGAVINGIAVALEEAKSAGDPLDDAAINAVKTSLMGPVSGVGDALIQGTCAPFMLSVGIGLARQGNLLGPLLYVGAMAVLIWGLGWTMFWQGYRGGKMYVLQVLQKGRPHLIMSAIEIAAAILLGVLGASYVRVPIFFTAWERQFGFLPQPPFGQLVPSGIALMLILIYRVLLRRRVPVAWLVAGTFLVGLGMQLIISIGWRIVG